MKRLLLSAAAGLMIAGPLSLPAFAQQGHGQGGYQGQGGQQSHQNDRGQPTYQAPVPPLQTPRQGQNQGQQNQGQQNQGQYGQGQYGQGQQGRDYADNRDWGRDGRNDRSQGSYRDNDRNARSNDRDHRQWKRGDKLGNYNQRYGQVDYRQYGVRRPPQGYRWVKDDSGDLLLAAVVGGLIAAIVSSH